MKEFNRRSANDTNPAKWMISASLVASLCAGLVSGLVASPTQAHITAPAIYNRQQRRAARARYPTLSRYGLNLSELARANAISVSPVQRAAALRLAETLRRSTRNNPVLVGDDAVVTAGTVEALAQLSVTDAEFKFLREKQIFSLDIDRIMTSAVDEEELDYLLQAAFTEAENSNGKVILFINQLHTSVAADAQNRLLAKGTARVLNRMAELGAMEIEAPARTIEQLAKLDATLYVSLNREVGMQANSSTCGSARTQVMSTLLEGDPVAPAATITSPVCEKRVSLQSCALLAYRSRISQAANKCDSLQPLSCPIHPRRS